MATKSKQPINVTKKVKVNSEKKILKTVFSDFKIASLPLNKISPYKKNPRNNENAIEVVAKSLQKFGFRQPIVVDKNFVIIVGHTRYEAAKQLGYKDVPVHVAENLTSAQARAYRIADNKTNEHSSWNFEILASELESLDSQKFDLSVLGFSESELKGLLGQVEGTEFPNLNSGGRGELQQITFTLHESQLDRVKSAIDFVLKNYDEVEDKSLNENKNGNALFVICDTFMNLE